MHLSIFKFLIFFFFVMLPTLGSTGIILTCLLIIYSKINRHLVQNLYFFHFLQHSSGLLHIFRPTWSCIHIYVLTSVQRAALPPRTRRTCVGTWWHTPTRSLFFASYVDRGRVAIYLLAANRLSNSNILYVHGFVSDTSGSIEMAIWNFTWSVSTIRKICRGRITPPPLNRPS